MATDLPMNPQMEQIHGEIRDNFRALANGFQKLEKIKDSSRQSKQLEELTSKMRECKRLIKEFDREIKDEETRNPPKVNKRLNDEKQSMPGFELFILRRNRRLLLPSRWWLTRMAKQDHDRDHW